MKITSPDETVVATLELNNTKEELTLTIDSNEVSIMDASPLGITTFEQEFINSLTIDERARRTLDTTYRTPAGKRRRHRYRANEATMTVSTATDETCEIDLRVSNDGVAYRYRLPGHGSVVVTGEKSGFRIPTNASAWLMPYEKKHEKVWRRTSPAEAAGQYSYPLLFEVVDQWVLLTEANVNGRYGASRLTAAPDDTLFTVRFPDSEKHRMETAPQEVSTSRPLVTPWRVAITGDLSTVVESDLVSDLMCEFGSGNDPNRIADSSWIRPGRVAWSWWSNGISPGDFDTQRTYVDYARDRGWEYVLIDAGWDAEWIPELVDYAEERDVDVLLWSRWSDLDTEAKRAARLSRWASWGVAGIKVDYMNSDTQEMMQFYDDLAEATADHELLLNVHGSIMPKGLRRRWPHLISYEGVYGAENYHPIPNTVPPTHNVILPFTRNVLGSMDYTPVTFSAETRQTTAGHELALAVVFESGLQHFADSVESYSSRPLAERVLELVPAVWDETRFVGGYPGETATIARRNGNQWFVGCITAGAERRITVPCSFLDGGRRYDAAVYRDNTGGDGLVSNEIEVTSGGQFSIEVPENGGFTAILRRASDRADESL